MKISCFFILTAAICCFQPVSYAQEYKDDDKTGDVQEVTPEDANTLRPGMEMRKVGGINMVVPEGVQFYRQGAQVKMEEAPEYSARRFKETDERLKNIEDKQDKADKEIKELRELITALNRPG